MLKEKISEDLKAALKERQERKVSVLRMLSADIKNLEIDSKHPATDEEVMKLLSSSAKKHQDSITQFKSGGRPDLVSKEEEELAILQSYLPAMLTPAELTSLIDSVITESGAATAADFGKVMKLLMPKIGTRANGQTVSQMLKAKLNPVQST